MTYTIQEAKRIFADHGYVARVSAIGGVLCVYDGDDEDPSTWMEIARCRLNRDGTIDGRSIQSIIA